MFTGTYGMGLMGGLMQTVQTLGNNIGNMVAPLAEDEEEQITRMIQDQLLASDDDRPDCNSNEEDEQDVSSLDNESENGSNASFRTINLSSNTPSESDSLSGLSHPNIPSQSFQYHPSNPISPLSYTHTYTQQQDNGEEEDDDDDMYPVNLTESLQIRSPPESPMTEIDLATPQDLNVLSPSSLPPYIHSDVKTSEEYSHSPARSHSSSRSPNLPNNNNETDNVNDNEKSIYVVNEELENFFSPPLTTTTTTHPSEEKNFSSSSSSSSTDSESVTLLLQQLERYRIQVESLSEEIRACKSEKQSHMERMVKDSREKEEKMRKYYDALLETKQRETAEAMAAESTRLTEALADSEAALKQAEEYLYIAKGENSELIWALEKEKENNNALNNAYKVVCQQLESNEESKNSTIQSLNKQIETLKREILIPPVSEKSSFPEPDFEKDHLFSALKSSVELISITKQISTHIHNGGGVVVTAGETQFLPDSSANLPSDITGMIEVLNASILEVNDALVRAPSHASTLSMIPPVSANRIEDEEIGLAVNDCLQQLQVLMTGSTERNGSNSEANLQDLPILDKLQRIKDIVVKAASIFAAETSELQKVKASLAEQSAEINRSNAERYALDIKLAEQTQQILSLQHEMQAKSSSLQDSLEEQKRVTQEFQEFQRLSSSVQKEFQELQHAYNSALSNGSAMEANIQSLKQQLQKSETEARQLHQIINQLRSVRMASKGESESLSAERDELRNTTTTQAAEIQRLEKLVSVNGSNMELIGKLRGDLTTAMNKVVYLDSALDDAKKKISHLEKECYDKQSKVEVTQSDLRLTQLELSQRQVELQNLQLAFQQIRVETEQQVSRVQSESDQQCEQLRAANDEKMRALTQEWQSKYNEEHQRRLDLEQSGQVADLTRRRLELEFNNEKKKMQSTLELTIHQLNNSQKDIIDKSLIANLVVSYFKKKRSLEVLDLIARILSFNEEQKIAVGLKVGPIDFMSTILSTVSVVIGVPPPPPEPIQVEGDNLAELWINFLINQAEGVPADKNATSTSSTSTTTTTSSSPSSKTQQASIYTPHTPSTNTSQLHTSSSSSSASTPAKQQFPQP